MEINPHHVTLAIVTKNRPQKLKRLLKSIHRLSLLPNQVLVVDNDLSQTAKEICQQWDSKLPLEYLFCSQTGTPYARNLALDRCQTRFLCFTDDDCVLKSDWLSILLKELNLDQPGFVVGGCKLLNKDNYWARLQFKRYQNWVQKLTVGNQVRPLFFDTKNVCLDLRQINQDQLRFDPLFAGLLTAGGEDLDFGLQLFAAGIKGRYLAQMIIWHEEVASLRKLIKKTYQKGQLEGFLYQKWQLCHVGERKKKDWLSKIFFWGVKSVQF